MNRRILLQSSLAAAALVAAPTFVWSRSVRDSTISDPYPQAKFRMDLCGGRVGIDAKQDELIELAAKNGFSAVEPLAWDLKSKSPEQISATNTKLAEKNLVWSAANLPVEFRQTQAKFKEDLQALPEFARALQAAGVNRIGTWIMPCHETMTFRENFAQHAMRLRAIAKILADHGLRLGIEYVGTKTLWTMMKFPFIHTMPETKELIAAIGQNNIGFILDSWHWTMAGETADEIRTLKNEQVVACDINDAPAGIAVDQQNDDVRELPMATGVIDIKSFLQSLVEIQYDGPIRAEPFNQALNEMDNESAAAVTAAAMKKAFATVDA